MSDLSTARSTEFYIIQDRYPRVVFTITMRKALAAARKVYTAAEIAAKAKAGGEPGVVVGAVFAYTSKIRNPDKVNQFWGARA